jgi:hypothetical protein
VNCAHAANLSICIISERTHSLLSACLHLQEVRQHQKTNANSGQKGRYRSQGKGLSGQGSSTQLPPSKFVDLINLCTIVVIEQQISVCFVH